MPRRAASLLLVCVGSAWMLAIHHDRSWWPPDEGQYAHVAERLLEGARLHRDIRDPHTDYGHWLNAGALALFGRDLRSLRYAPAAASLLGALGVAWLLRTRGIGLATVTALATTALGFVQFPDPTPNWYGPLWCVALALVAGRGLPRSSLVSGAIVGVAFGFRQPTGALLGLGALVLELGIGPEPAPSPATRPRLAPALLALAAIASAWLVWLSTDALGGVLYGVWPVAVLAAAARRTRVDDRTASRRAAGLVAGAGAALAPMLLWHALQGTLGAWGRDVLGGALAVPRLAYLGEASFAHWLGPALHALAHPASLREALNAAYWLVLPSLGAVAGPLLLARWWRAAPRAPAEVALPLFACFHAGVALLQQIPIYAYYAAGPLLAAIVQLLAPRSHAGRALLGGAVAALAAIGLAFHASQPHTRTIAQAIAGERVALVDGRSLPRASLWMERDQLRAYRDLLARVHALTTPSDRLLVVPNDAEVYFLAQRQSAVDFWSSALGITGPREEEALVGRLRASPPALVVIVRGDKSTTPALERVLTRIADLYAAPERVHYFELWHRSPTGSPEPGTAAGRHGGAPALPPRTPRPMSARAP